MRYVAAALLCVSCGSNPDVFAPARLTADAAPESAADAPDAHGQPEVQADVPAADVGQPDAPTGGAWGDPCADTTPDVCPSLQATLDKVFPNPEDTGSHVVRSICVSDKYNVWRCTFRCQTSEGYAFVDARDYCVMLGGTCPNWSECWP